VEIVFLLVQIQTIVVDAEMLLEKTHIAVKVLKYPLQFKIVLVAEMYVRQDKYVAIKLVLILILFLIVGHAEMIV